MQLLKLQKFLDCKKLDKLWKTKIFIHLNSVYFSYNEIKTIKVSNKLTELFKCNRAFTQNVRKIQTHAPSSKSSNWNVENNSFFLFAERKKQQDFSHIFIQFHQTCRLVSKTVSNQTDVPIFLCRKIFQKEKLVWKLHN